jgi:hypothetical protein
LGRLVCQMLVSNSNAVPSENSHAQTYFTFSSSVLHCACMDFDSQALQACMAVK